MNAPDSERARDFVDRLNDRFERVGLWSYDHRRLVLVSAVLVLALSSWLAGRVGFAFTVIALLLCVVFHSVKTGVIAMLPNLSPVILTLGVMGWMGIPLDYVRLLIASVAIGISVDDTIHHTAGFRLEFRRRGRYAEALRAANLGVGRALVITSLVLMVGFLMMLLSRLDSIGSFGTLLATTIGVALVADFLLMPALVLVFQPWGPETQVRQGVGVGLEVSSLAAG